MSNFNVIKLLKSGYFVKAKLNNSDLFYKTIILSIENGNLIIPFSPEFRFINLLEQDLVVIKYSIDQYTLVIDCIVQEIVFNDLPIVRLLPINGSSFKNNRESERFDVNLVCKVNEQTKTFNSFAIDISTAGCGILCTNILNLELNQTINIFSDFFNVKDCIKVYGKIASCHTYSKSKFHYGFQFVNMSESEKTLIRTITNNVQREEQINFQNVYKKYSSQYKLENPFFTK